MLGIKDLQVNCCVFWGKTWASACGRERRGASEEKPNFCVFDTVWLCDRLHHAERKRSQMLGKNRQLSVWICFMLVCGWMWRRLQLHMELSWKTNRSSWFSPPLLKHFPYRERHTIDASSCYLKKHSSGWPATVHFELTCPKIETRLHRCSETELSVKHTAYRTVVMKWAGIKVSGDIQQISSSSDWKNN